MKIKKIKQENGTYNIDFINEKYKFSIMYCDNLDLYWTIYDLEYKNDKEEIKKFEIIK